MQYFEHRHAVCADPGNGVGGSCRGAIDHELTPAEIREAVLLVAMYCGMLAGPERWKIGEMGIWDKVVVGDLSWRGRILTFGRIRHQIHCK